MAATPADCDHVIISGRALALIASPAMLRRARVAYRGHELYGELRTITDLVFACGNASKVAVAVGRPGQSELLGTATAARRAGVTQSAIRLAISERRLPATRIAGRWLIPAAAVDAYARNRDAHQRGTRPA